MRQLMVVGTYDVRCPGVPRRAKGCTPAQVALAWLLQQPGISAPIIGATKMSHLDAAVAALDVSLTSDECQRLEQPYVAHDVRW